MIIEASSLHLGVDPSATSTGIAILGLDTEPKTVLIRPKNLRGPDRLVFIRDELLNFLDKYLSNPIKSCVEDFSYKSINKADTLGQVRGIILLTLADLKIPIVMVAPKSLKKFGAKSGDASKEQMIIAAHNKWGIYCTDDEADALWLAQLSAALNGAKIENRKQMEVIHGIRNPKITSKFSVQSTLDI
jgi:Holliday junction resolvasome RuvABC endonuclease subunit